MTASWRRAARLLALAGLLAPIVAACSAGGLGPKVNRAAFGSEYGSASPRVTNNPNPPKGGGRYQVGKPYTVAGRTYVPQEDPDYVGTGSASWYGADFHGRRTANGEIFSANALTGAHPTLPLPSYVRVTNQDNGRSIIVRVNDRGPYMPGRIMDLSYRAAAMLGYVTRGSTSIKAEYVGPAPLEGDDTRMLMASYSGPADFDTGAAYRTADNTNSLADIAGNFVGGLFSYADSTPVQGGAGIGSAQAAVNAMASGDAALGRLDLPLGVFASAEHAAGLAQQFALLGSVSEELVEINGRQATQLTLTQLKPGATRSDVEALAQSLGLGDARLY